MAVEVIPTDGAPAIGSWQWTIPGTRVEGYDVVDDASIGESSGETNELTEDECQTANVCFHWVDGGNNRLVSCSTIVQSVTHTVVAKFDVEGIVSTFTCTIGDVGVDEWWGSGDWRLHFGWISALSNANGPEGIEFAYSASSPPAGTFKMRQLITSVTHKKQMTADGTWKIASGSDYLDTNLFMPDAVDSPCSEGLTQSYLNYETSTTFSTWLMYKPDSTGAIFVPLRKIDWFWSGKATRSGTTWSLTASEKPSAALTSTTTVDFPEWTHNIDYVQLQFQ